MSKKKITIDEAFEYGWDTMKSKFWFFVAILVFVFVIELSLSYLIKNFGSLSWILTIIYYIVSILFSLGFIKITLDIYSKKRSKFLDIVTSYELFFDYFVATIIYSVIVVAGLVLFIVPGILLMLKLMFYPYYIVDKKMGPIKALKASWKATTNQKSILFIFWLISLLINLIGALVIGIGLFVSLPVTVMAQVYIYKKLIK